MPEPNSSHVFLSDHVLGIIGVLLALIGLALAFLSKEVREQSKKLLHSYGRQSVSLLASLMLFSGIALLIGRSSAPFAAGFFVIAVGVSVAVWRLGLVLAAQRKYEKIEGRRWNKLTDVTFGHLTYEPFSMTRMGNLVGFGVDLLHQLFETNDPAHEVKVSAYGVPQTWDNVLSSMGPTTYQVVGTPIFATFDRSREAAFTAPLFFSNIGLYIRADLQAKFFEEKICIDDLNDTLRRNPFKLIFLSVPGEISSKLAEKYAGQSSIEQCKSQTILEELFNRIADPSSPPLALFCESFYAYHQPSLRLAKPKVVNLLRSHEILYPVCFAVRHGDYQLRNFLNIRLLQSAKKNGSALDQLAKNLPKYGFNDISPAVLAEHFADEWPVAQENVDA